MKLFTSLIFIGMILGSAPTLAVSKSLSELPAIVLYASGNPSDTRAPSSVNVDGFPMNIILIVFVFALIIFGISNWRSKHHAIRKRPSRS